jgi:thymidylate synthase ThyX
MYNAKILADSISPEGYRLTSYEVTFPRFILAEFNTHRVFSRNSASSRAIPVRKSIQAVKSDPFVPSAFGKNQPGMSADETLDELAALDSLSIWNAAIDDAIWAAEYLEQLDVHKSLANRILEPYKWHTVIVTSTDWDNFFALRTAKDAQPEFQHVAKLMEQKMQASEPRELYYDEWHLPLINDDEYKEAQGDFVPWKKVSIGRCARVSYLTHDGKRDPEADIDLYERLKEKNHLSPFEHVARPFSIGEWGIISEVQNYLEWINNGGKRIDPLVRYLCQRVEYRANFRGWVQARAEIPNEDNASLLMPVVT